MSLYNMVNGFNPACVLIMPMLGRKQEEWPRFRDCYVTPEHNIAIFTRVGGGNREQGYGEEKLYDDPNFLRTYDYDADNTYAIYEFSVPDKWKRDFDVIMKGKFTDVSLEYINYLKHFFPILNKNGVIDKIFSADIK